MRLGNILHQRPPHAVSSESVGLPAATREGALGLESMRLRAEEVGSTLTLETDAGTTVTVVLPIQEEQ